MLYVTEFLVTAPEGTVFPMDMLRYDACFPRTEEDSYLITASLDRVQRGEQHVKLAQYTPTKQSRITHGRWQSFGWKVLLVNSHKM